LLMEFLAGVWLSELVRRGRFPGFKIAVAMVVAGLFGFAISLRQPAPDLWRCLVWGVPSLLVVYGAISMELRRGLPRIKSLKLLGDGSYSIYLFHPFVFLLVTTSITRLPALIPAVVVVVTGIAIGMAAFYTLERPLTGLLKRWSTRVIAVAATNKISIPTPQRL